MYLTIIDISLIGKTPQRGNAGSSPTYQSNLIKTMEENLAYLIKVLANHISENGRKIITNIDLYNLLLKVEVEKEKDMNLLNNSEPYN